LNAVAFLGIDPCEKEPGKAFRLNTLYPKFLAELSKEKDFLLVHFSTDAVFSDKLDDFCKETDKPQPLNVYGFTKYGGDCFIQAIAKKYYIFRISILFGETSKETQFVEKMLQKIKAGQRVLKISGDIISSPTYSKDVAREVKRIVGNKYAYGLYHLSNTGKASLYDLIKEIVDNLELVVKIEKCSYKDFPCIGIKNTCTLLKSEKIKPLRPWQVAAREYCRNIKGIYNKK
jgi:dTDP-4-dehydrorhamnose reductase